MVRFDDGPTTEAAREISAPPQAIWPLVTDISLPASHSDELQRSEWLDGCDRPALGARFAGHNRRGELTWQTICTITEMEEPERFTWRVDSGDHQVSTWGFQLTPTATGTTVRQWTVLGPGRSGLTWAIRQHPEQEEAIIAGRLQQLQQSMGRNLEAIAAALEA